MDNNIQNYAGFWRRFAAYVIDWVVLAYFIISVFWFFDRQLQFKEISYEVARNITSIIMIPISIIFYWCYYSGFESSPLKATIGKLAVGIFVTDLEGKRISFGKATGRYFGKIISSIIFLIGFIMAGFTEKKQALHDIIAGCLVLKK